MPPLSFEQRRRRTTTRLAALMLANAFIFQEHLSRFDKRVASIQDLLGDEKFIEKTCAVWTFIMDEINYVPIFKVARDIVSTLPTSAETEASMRGLARRGLEIAANKAALRHDLMGRIYHLLLTEAKYLGTYYTSVPAATMLLTLTLDVDRWPHIDWSDSAAVNKLRIGDLACGTGTLLMAACQAVKDNFIKFRSSAGQVVDAASLNDLHRTMIEETIHGYDVLPSAVHLTASTLALLSPDICFKAMHLYTLPIGKLASGQVCLGSIEYVSGDRIGTQLDFISSDSAGAEHVGGDLKGAVAPLPPLDVCVMNPPFVRSVGGNLLFGAAGDKRGQMRAELGRRLRATNLAASATAGLGGIFAAIGDKHVKEGGRIALVLPAAITTGVSWRRTRDLISHKYHLETIITSHDPEAWSFSENTELSEVLLIARKRARRADLETVIPRESTQFVSLWINPRTSAHALAVSEQISRGAPAPIGTIEHPRRDISTLMVGSRKYGETLEIPSHEVRDAPWIGAAFAQSALVRAAWMLRQGRFYSADGNAFVEIPMTTISAIGVLGPDRRDVADAFTRSDAPTTHCALWGSSGSRCRTIAARANTWLRVADEPIGGRRLRDPDLLWRRSGRIMIAERSWMNTQRTLALRLDEPALSNVWWPLRLRKKSEAAEKAFVLWLNSTLGILTLIAHRIPTRGAWVQFKKPTIQQLPVLDVGALTTSQVERIVAAYDDTASSELGGFIDMSNDPVRARVDAVFEATLGLSPMDELRASLAREPIISLKPFEANGKRSMTDDQHNFEST